MSVRERLLELIPREGRYWLFATALLLLVGWVKGINLLMLLACLMLAVWVVNCVVAVLQVRRLQARRRSLGPIFAGSEACWDVELTNARPLASSGWRISDRGPAHRQEWFQETIDGHQTVRLRARAILPRRGRYRCEPLAAGCLHPFGLAQIRTTLAPADDWLVLPGLGRLNVARFRRWLARMSRGDLRRHRVARPSMIRQDDLHGLRPFRPGDSPRWIHWRTSARRNEKMVREFEELSGQNLILVLEPWTPHGAAEDRELEAAVSLAATICWNWSAQKNDLLMLAIAGRSAQVLSGYASRDLAMRMLRELAVVEGQSASDLPEMQKALSRKPLPDAPVVLVSPRRDSPLRRQLARTFARPILGLTLEAASEFFEMPATLTHRDPAERGVPSKAANFATEH